MSRKTDSTGEGKGKAPRSQERGAVSVHRQTVETEWECLGDEIPKKGRPTLYTEELAAVICALIAEGYSLRKIAALDNMPQTSTILRWLFNPSDFKDAFSEQYRRARQMQAELHADEVIDIADDSIEDEVFTDDGRRMLNREFVQRSKLRVETRQWVAMRLLPKVYGPNPGEATDDTPPPPTSVEIVVKDARQ